MTAQHTNLGRSVQSPLPCIDDIASFVSMNETASTDFRMYLNPRCDRRLPYGAEQNRVICRASRNAAREAIGHWSAYQPSPLVDVPDLAERFGIARLRIKHEGFRTPVGSFKALGAFNGVMRLLGRETGASLASLSAGDARDQTQGITLCTATDGNHGRAVAWAAGMAGAQCVVYLHEHVSPGREEAIAAYGARIKRVDGVYDDSVRAAAADARKNGWFVLSDTAWPGYEEIPCWVMQGYSVIMAEILDEVARDMPTHVLVQAGVGGLATGIIAPLWEDFGEDRPMCGVVEPHAANCLYQSAVDGKARPGDGSLETVMACLAAGEPSPLAWSVLNNGADAFVSIADRYCPEAMLSLAQCNNPMVVGESGAAGLAGLIAVSEEPDARHAFGLDGRSDVLVIASEGATDPAIYRQITGFAPQEVGLPAAGQTN